MRTFIAALLFCILLVICWPLAVLVIFVFPLVWLVLLPFRIIGLSLSLIFQFLGVILLFPFRALGKV